MALISFLAF